MNFELDYYLQMKLNIHKELSSNLVDSEFFVICRIVEEYTFFITLKRGPKPF